LTLLTELINLELKNEARVQLLIFKVIGPKWAHNLFIRSWAKKGLFLELISFRISELKSRSSLKTKRAHNPEVAGSIPAPATNLSSVVLPLLIPLILRFWGVD
jgi:hypothetical protein